MNKFNIILEQTLRPCVGAALLPGGRVAAVSYPSDCKQSQVLKLIDSTGSTLSETKLPKVWVFGVLPSEGSRNVTLHAQKLRSAGDDVGADFEVLVYDDDGCPRLRASAPFGRIAQFTGPGDDGGYLVSGTHWHVSTGHVIKTQRAAHLSAKAQRMRLLDVDAAAHLASRGKCASLRKSRVEVGFAHVDGTCRASIGYDCPLPDACWLLMVNGVVFVANESELAGVCEVAHSGIYKRLPSPVAWRARSGPIFRYVSREPYIVAAAAPRLVYLIEATRAESIELGADSVNHFKEVLSIDAAASGPNVVVMTLHRELSSTDTVLRLWRG